MTVRESSAIAYREVLESGYIGKKQKEVYAGLYEFGPCTATELYYAMGWNRNPSHSNITTRLGELRDDYKVVEELPKRKCRKTGNLVIVWQVNGERPVKPKRPNMISCPTCKGHGKVFMDGEQMGFL